MLLCRLENDFYLPQPLNHMREFALSSFQHQTLSSETVSPGCFIVPGGLLFVLLGRHSICLCLLVTCVSLFDGFVLFDLVVWLYGFSLVFDALTGFSLVWLSLSPPRGCHFAFPVHPLSGVDDPLSKDPGGPCRPSPLLSSSDLPRSPWSLTLCPLS